MPQPSLDSAAYDRTRSSVEYEALVQELERNYGPYHDGLLEPLAGLGFALQQKGEYAASANAFRRAMHIQRVKSGLYTLNQLPLLDLVIDSNMAAQDWDQVDKDFQYYLWIHRRTYENNDAQLLAPIERLSHWHLAAVRLDSAEKQGEHLLKLLELSRRAIEIAETQYGATDPRLVEHLYRLALRHYYIAVAVQNGDLVGEMLVDTLTPIMHRKSYEMARDEVILNSYRAGRKLLSRVVSLCRDAAGVPAEAGAVALTYFADWELLFDHRGAALSAYGEAFDSLEASGMPREQIHALFSVPVLLPREDFRTKMELQDWSQPKEAVARRQTPVHIDFVAWTKMLPGLHFPSRVIARVSPGTEQRFALATFKVRENGWAENIRIVEHHPDTGAIYRQVGDGIKSMRFRPRLEDGRAAPTANIEIRYVLPE